MNNRNVLAASAGIFALKTKTKASERRGFDLRIFEQAFLRHHRLALGGLWKPGRCCGLRVPGLHPHERICALTRSSACTRASRPHAHRQAHVSANQWATTLRSPTSSPTKLRLGTPALPSCRHPPLARGPDHHGFAFSTTRAAASPTDCQVSPASLSWILA